MSQAMSRLPRLYRYKAADAAFVPTYILQRFDARPWWDDGIGRRFRSKRIVLQGRAWCLYDSQFYCADCTVSHHTWPIYMVKHVLWEKFGNGLGMLCPRCFQRRLGRPLVKDDLNDAPCNSFAAVTTWFKEPT